MPTWAVVDFQACVPLARPGDAANAVPQTASASASRSASLGMPGHQDPFGEGNEPVEDERDRAQDENCGEDARGCKRRLRLQDD